MIQKMSIYFYDKNKLFNSCLREKKVKIEEVYVSQEYVYV